MPSRVRARGILVLAGVYVMVTGIVSGCGVSGPGATPRTGPTSKATPLPSPTPSVSPASPAPAAGMHRLESIGQVGPAPAAISVTVPPGWTADGFTVGKAAMDVEPLIGVWQINNRFDHPCTDHTLLKPAPGPGVDELIKALASQPGITAGPITDVTIDGYRGRSVELTVTIDGHTCPERFWLWASPDGDHRDAGQPEMDRIYALDVDGKRFTFFARIPLGTIPEDLATLEAIIDSIEIEAGPSTSPSP